MSFIKTLHLKHWMKIKIRQKRMYHINRYFMEIFTTKECINNYANNCLLLDLFADLLAAIFEGQIQDGGKTW